MGPIRCPETSVKDYHSTLRDIPEERRCQVTPCNPHHLMQISSTSHCSKEKPTELEAQSEQSWVLLSLGLASTGINPTPRVYCNTEQNALMLFHDHFHCRRKMCSVNQSKKKPCEYTANKMFNTGAEF
jgi:hypothetical protein